MKTIRGFTLIELLIVIAVIGVLSVGVLTALNVTSQIGKANLAKAKTFSASVENSLAISQIGKWSFDDPSDPGKDTSGYGNNGTLSGAPPPTFQSSSTCGLGFGGCLDFNGTSSYVNVASFQSVANRNEYTIAAWFKTDKVSVTDEQWIMGESSSAANSPVVNLGVSANSLAQYFHRDEGNPQEQALMTFAIKANEWHYVVGVRKASNSFEFFVDGVRRGTSNNNPGTTTTNQFNIGRLIRPDPRPDYFDGLIDEVAVYSQALTAQSIKQLYAKGLLKYKIVGYKTSQN